MRSGEDQANAALLRGWFDAALAAAEPDRALGDHIPAAVRGRTIVVGAGKAAAAMARAFEKRWPGPLEGLVLTRYGHAVSCDRIEIVEASHPVPDMAGVRASHAACSTSPMASGPTTSWCFSPRAAARRC